MFGYVTPLKDDLKVYELNAFKSYYCGLCHHIKNQFGEVPRMVLNYDLTALALLLDGLSPYKTYMKPCSCLTHPLTKKAMIIKNDALTYAANMNVALAYYKCLDDLQDEGSFKSECLAFALKPSSKKFKKEVLPINHYIAKQLKALYQLEKNKNFCSLDEIAHPFSLILGHILKAYPYALVNDSPALREELFDFGYALGKWIYIIDALDDLKEDMAKGQFNPINHLYNDEHLTYDILFNKVREPISFTLLNCGYNCRDLLKSLPLRRNRALMENIIIYGMMDRFDRIVYPACKSCKGVKSHG